MAFDPADLAQLEATLAAIESLGIGTVDAKVEIDKLTPALKELVTRFLDLGGAVSVHRAAVLGGTGGLDELRRATIALTEAQKAAKKAEEDAKKATEELAKAAAEADKTLGSFKTSLSTVTNVLLSTEKGLTKYNDILDKASNQLTEQLSKFGAVGKAAGLAVDGLTWIAKQTLAVNDNLIAAKRELSSIGAIGKLTSEEIRKIGEASNYSSATIKSFTKAAASLGPSLVALGGNANDGVLAFGAMTAVTRDQIDYYRSMGVEQEQLTQNQADYVKLLVQSGKGVSDKMKQDGAMLKASLAYQDNLLVLSELTGLSGEKLKKEQERAASYVEGQIRLEAMQREADKARAKGGPEGDAEADKIEGQIDSLGKMIAEAQIKGGDAAGAAVAKMVGGKGAISTPEQMMMFKDLPGKYQKAMSGTLKEGEVAQDLETKRGENIDANSFAAAMAPEFRKMLGMDNSEVNARMAATRGVYTPEKIKEVTERNRKAKEDKEKNKVLVGDKNEQAVATKEKVEFEAQVLRDKAVQLMGAQNAMYIAGIAALGNLAFSAIAAAGSLRGLGGLPGGGGPKVPGGSAANLLKGAAKFAAPAAAALSVYGGVSDIGQGKKVESAGDIVPEGWNKINPMEWAMRGGRYAGDKLNAGYKAGSELAGGSGSLGSDIYGAFNEDPNRIKNEEARRTASGKITNMTAVTAPVKPVAAPAVAAPAVPVAQPVQSSADQRVQKEMAANIKEMAKPDRLKQAEVGGAILSKPEEKTENKVSEDKKSEKEKELVLVLENTTARLGEFSGGLFQAKNAAISLADAFSKVRPSVNSPRDISHAGGDRTAPAGTPAAATSVEEAKRAGAARPQIAPGVEPVVPVKPGKFSGFGKETDTNIAEASKKFGMDEKTMRGFVKMEGGWTGKMSPTGAIGTGQFIQSTWNSMAKTKEGQEIGMKPITKETFRTSQDPRFDPKVNMMATALLSKNNAKLLEGAGLPVTGENLYMLHNIGPGVMSAIKGGSVSQATLLAMQQNGMRPGQTPADFVAMQKGKFNKQSELANADNMKSQETVTASAQTTKPATLPQAQEGGIFSGAKSGFPVELHGNELVAPYNPNSILAKLLTQEPSASAEAKIRKETVTPPEVASKTTDISKITDDLMALLSDKFDSLIDAMESSKDTQEKILQNARA